MDRAAGDVALTILPPLITAVLAALGLWFAEWRKDRGVANRRLATIGEETAQLHYLRSWLKTEQLASNGAETDTRASREEVCRELMRSRMRLGEALEVHTEPDAPAPLLRVWRNVVLIPLHRPVARVLRWCYWFVLIAGALMMMLIFSTDYSEVDGMGFGVMAIVAFILVLPVGAVALGLHAGARALERRGASIRGPGYITPERSRTGGQPPDVGFGLPMHDPVPPSPSTANAVE